MSAEIFNDPSMMEIFRAEVETHAESLTAGLLALERDPGDTSHVDEMMRAAHSIKGAARIVGIDPAVRLAHVMEDGFVAAQHGELMLLPSHVDALLRGVDMFNRIANGSKDPAVDWSQFDPDATRIVAEISGALAGAVISETVAPAAPASPAPTAPVLSPLSIVLPTLLDAGAAESARRAFVAGLDAKAPAVRFDLSATTDIDATGLAFLAAVPGCTTAGVPRVELCGVSADLQYVLQATGIERLFVVGSG